MSTPHSKVIFEVTCSLWELAEKFQTLAMHDLFGEIKQAQGPLCLVIVLWTGTPCGSGIRVL